MRAVVLEVRGREAALLMEDGTVRRVRGKYEVGQQLVFYDLVRPGVRQWVAAVVVAAILLAGSVGMWFNNNYVSYAEVSLDAEASIVYSLNRRNRVLSVRAANSEAEPVVQTLDDAGIRFTPLPEALDMTMEKLTEAGYLKGGGQDCVLASVASDNETQREALAQQVEAAMDRRNESAPGLEYRVDRTDRATARAAEENGMSPGRYGAWQQSGGEKSPGDYAQMPVDELLGHPAQTAPEPSNEKPETEAEPKTEAESMKEEPKVDEEPTREEPKAEAEPMREEPKAEAEPAREEPKAEAEPMKDEPKAEVAQPEGKAGSDEPKEDARPEGEDNRKERSEGPSERHDGGHDAPPGGGPGGGPGR